MMLIAREITLNDNANRIESFSHCEVTTAAFRIKAVVSLFVVVLYAPILLPQRN